MPGYPLPVGSNGPFSPHWNAVLQAIAAAQRATAELTAGATQGNLLDRWGNTVEVGGTNLSQIVIVGAAYRQPGVQVSTLLSGAGRAKQVNLATGTITLTAGSTSATLVSTTSGTFGGAGTNPIIGAVAVKDPTSGVTTPAIKPGTTYTISSGTVTLSQPAAESGTALYCAAVNFVLL